MGGCYVGFVSRLTGLGIVASSLASRPDIPATPGISGVERGNEQTWYLYYTPRYLSYKAGKFNISRFSRYFYRGDSSRHYRGFHHFLSYFHHPRETLKRIFTWNHRWEYVHVPRFFSRGNIYFDRIIRRLFEI